MIPSLFLEPGFLEGWIRHKRFQPRKHAFTQKKTWVCVDADKLNQFGQGLPGWHFEARGLHTLYRTSFLGSPNVSIRTAVERLCDQYGVKAEFGQILAIAACEDLGININPAQFYLVHDLEANLLAIICELKNRNDEFFPYVFVVTDQYNLSFKCDKALYISPHTSMDAVYFWDFYIGKRHFMFNLEVEYPEDPSEEKVNSLLFPEKARRDALKKKVMEITMSSTLRPFNEKVAQELGKKYILSGFRSFMARMWNKLMLNENGLPFKHPSLLKEEHPRQIAPPVSNRKSKRLKR